MNTRKQPSERLPSIKTSEAKPKNNNSVTLAFFSEETGSEGDPAHCLDKATLSPELFWAMHLDAEAKGQSLTEWIEDAVMAKSGPLIDLDNPKTSKGFVQINLPEADKKEIRAAAHGCRMPLNQALRMAIIDMRTRLRKAGEIMRMTGMDGIEQSRFFGNNNKLN